MGTTKEVLNVQQYVYPIRTLVNYVSLLNSSNEIVLTVYLLGLFASVIVVLYFVLKKILSIRRYGLHNSVYKAVSEENVIKALKLIKQNPEVINSFNMVEGYTPFLKACLNGNTQLVKYMIMLGANLNIKSLNNESPFYLSTYNHIKLPQKKDASCIHALYHAGADLEAVNKNGYTPLQLASICGHSTLVQWLLQKNANLNVQPDPYILARMEGHSTTATIIQMFKDKNN